MGNLQAANQNSFCGPGVSRVKVLQPFEENSTVQSYDNFRNCSGLVMGLGWSSFWPLQDLTGCSPASYSFHLCRECKPLQLAPVWSNLPMLAFSFWDVVLLTNFHAVTLLSHIYSWMPSSSPSSHIISSDTNTDPFSPLS